MEFQDRIREHFDASVETKRRSRDAIAADIARAAEMWAWKHPAYRDYHFGLDIITISPWRLPRHLIDGLQPI